jgi:hypothetical protein
MPPSTGTDITLVDVGKSATPVKVHTLTTESETGKRIVRQYLPPPSLSSPLLSSSLSQQKYPEFADIA